MTSNAPYTLVINDKPHQIKPGTKATSISFN